MYRFIFGYDGDANSEIVLPVAPSSFKTKVGNKNKTVELISIGEANILKNIGLRDFSFKVLLPHDRELSGLDENEFHEPLFYLTKFRDFKAAAKPVRFKIMRLTDDTESFKGNLLVSFEDYSVEENAGEEHDYWVELKLKEYRSVETTITKLTGGISADGKAEASVEVQRAKKEIPKTYVIKANDSLWKIAQLQLGNGSRYNEIAQLNNISDPTNLAGMEGKEIYLPQEG